ncbi:MAG: hypothetical protein PVG82_03435 [Chromatiales bacterium]
MKRLSHQARTLLLIVLALSPAGAAIGDEKGTVQDLAYGEVLYHFYQRDYFPAITRLLIAREQGRFERQAEDAELLLGGLSLSYGLHQRAGEIFRVLLDGDFDREVRDQAWFYLAKLYYQRGYAEQSWDALQRVEGELEDELEDDRRMLGALLLLGRGDDEAAREWLDDWNAPSEWEPYALYNEAIAAIRAGDFGSGEKMLNKVGRMSGPDEETRTLRDKANLGLGSKLLEAGRGRQALYYFQRVRLHGPMSTRALLGAGWAAASLGDYEGALTPWGELRERTVLDPAVQESLLAMPYAYGQLEAYTQAAAAYESSIQSFQDEQARLDEAIASIRDGRLIIRLLSQEEGPQLGWFRELQALPDAPETRYLPELMASHDFQEAYKNLRDLEFLRRNLEDWMLSMGAFDEMLEVRRQAYNERLPRVDAYLEQVDLDAIRARRDALRNRIETAATADDALAFATPEEHAAWTRLVEIESTLAALPGDQQTEEIAAKQRLLKGVLSWQLDQQFIARRWELTKGLKDLDAAVTDVEQRRAGLEQAKLEAQARFQGYGDRIAELRARTEALHDSTYLLVSSHAQHLERLAVRELEQQKQRLDSYVLQARFSLAQMYDRAAILARPSE